MEAVGILRYERVFVLFMCLFCCCARPPRVFDKTPTDAEVNPGEVIVLECSVKNPTGECGWLKDGGLKWSDAKYDYTRGASTGDCTLKIMNASLQDDDGVWECQFPAYQGQLQLKANARITVRQAPVKPYIEHRDEPLYSKNLTVLEDKQSVVKCVSRKGNPAAVLKWFLDDAEITSSAMQNNENDSDMPKTHKATSTLKYTFQKDQNGKTLKCVAQHKAYEGGRREVTITLDVLYKPSLMIEGPPKHNIVERQSLTLSCIADGNPPAYVFWSKDHLPLSTKANITFANVSRTDSGKYRCRAKNDIGESQELVVDVNVNFPAKVLSVDPSNGFTATLYQVVTMFCNAEGNPPPKFSWFQITSGKPNSSQIRGSSATLTIENVTYSYQGMYVCQVSNLINGVPNISQSEKKIALNVRGPPQIMRELGDMGGKKVVVEKDEDAEVVVEFCAFPYPQTTYWEWGSVRLNSGSDLPRYVAQPVTKIDDRKDCFEARLIVQHVETSDSRKYTFVTENDIGRDVIAIPLEVHEPVTVSAVIGIVVSCVIILVVVVLVIIYFVRKDKCMFLRARGFKPDSDNGSTGMSEELHNGHAGDQAIPPDALYTNVEEQKNYDNLGRNSHNAENIVYADLDLQSLEANKNIAVKKPRPKQESTEYAELQFTPKKSATQADI